MPVLDAHISTLSRIAVERLAAEDARLFDEFDAAIRTGRIDSGRMNADKLARGVGFWIREEVLIFSIFRAALRSGDLPLEIRWEHKYPASTTKMDLALFDRASNLTSVPDACIEAKWWNLNGPVLEDIEKMRRGLPGPVRKFVLLVGQASDAGYETVRGWASGPPQLPLTFRPEWHEMFRFRREENVDVDENHWPFFYVTFGEGTE